MTIIMAQSGTTVNLIPLLTDRGLTPASAAGMAGLMGVAILFGRAGIGALLDRGRPALTAGLALAMPMLAAILLATGGANRVALTLAVLLLGLGAGAEIDFLSYFIGRYFGLRAYGRIYGALFIAFSLGNGLGSPLMAASFDHFGSYAPSLWGAAVAFAIGAALFAALGLFPMFERPAAPDDAGGRPDADPRK
jgi:predicted MFS family arabinose efflux permease